MCGFMKGLGAGMIAGVCVGMTLTMDKRRSKKMLHRAVRTMEDMAERVSDAIGM
ncbi:MAG: hypothetical protein IKV79_02245 [Oscillospiraceae bacterium]|nr:hypothetical protein [Oscillospiraceae bacterium]